MAKSDRKRTQKGMPKKADTNGESSGAVRWFPDLDYYPKQSVLQFESDTDLESAIDLLWTDELRELPHDTAGRKTLIIPTEAVCYFADAGLRFGVSELRQMGDLSPEEMKSLRR
jgi:hypothetical protein